MMYHNNSLGKQMSKFVAILLLLATGWVQAAQITVRADRSPVHVDETFQLIFSLDSKPAVEPDFSVLNQSFEVLGKTQSHNISIVNGKTTRSIQYRVTVLPRHEGQLTVPPVRFGQDLSPELRLLVSGTAVTSDPAGKVTKESVFLEVSVNEGKPYVQQQVILTVRIFSRIQWREASLSEPQFEGGEVLLKKLGQDRRYQKQRDGKTWQVIERRYALFPQKSGELKMQLLTLNLRIPGERQNNRSPFSGFNDPFMDDFFSRRTYRNKIVRSQGLALDVQPIPSTFDGQRWLVAGDVRLEESWSEDIGGLKAGEPVTRTLAIIADGVTLGQLPELQLPVVDGLRVYPDDPVTREQATDKGILSTSSRKFAIIPTQAGHYQLPAVELKWWNSRIGREQTAKIPSKELIVTGAATIGNMPQAGTGETEPQKTVSVNRDQTGSASPSTAPSPEKQPYTPINKWLVAGNIFLLMLWLMTLFLLMRKKTVPDHTANVEIQPEKVNLAKAKKQLQLAVASGDAESVREALLNVAKGLWRENPPTSLEAMAEKLDQPLAQELEALSRYLYADRTSKWNARKIEQGVNALQPQAEFSNPDSALKPLYPLA
jgi:hypothetical protein